MSYDVRYFGEITVIPPAPADQLISAGFPEPGSYGDKDIAVRVTETPIDGVPGGYQRIATAFEPCMGSYTAYRMVEHLQQAIDLLGPGHTFDGRITGWGPEFGEVFAVEVHDGLAVDVKGRIVWPDGSEQAIR